MTWIQSDVSGGLEDGSSDWSTLAIGQPITRYFAQMFSIYFSVLWAGLVCCLRAVCKKNIPILISAHTVTHFLTTAAIPPSHDKNIVLNDLLNDPITIYNDRIAICVSKTMSYYIAPLPHLCYWKHKRYCMYTHVNLCVWVQLDVYTRTSSQTA